MSDSSNLEVLSLFFTMLFYYLINTGHHLNFSLPSICVSLTFLNMAQAQQVVIFSPLFIYFLTFASQEKKSLVLRCEISWSSFFVWCSQFYFSLLLMNFFHYFTQWLLGCLIRCAHKFFDLYLRVSLQYIYIYIYIYMQNLVKETIWSMLA
jgi:hypothetical protein